MDFVSRYQEYDLHKEQTHEFIKVSGIMECLILSSHVSHPLSLFGYHHPG